MKKITIITILFLINFSSYAAKPLFIIEPTTSNQISISSTSFEPITYKVTNNSTLTRKLTMQATPGILQNTSPYNQNACSKAFTLAPNQFCYLNIFAMGSIMSSLNIKDIIGGPIICKTKARTDDPDIFLCERPEQKNELKIKLNQSNANITTFPQNLFLTISGDAEYIEVSNNSSTVVAKNISANFDNTLLASNVTQDASACVSLAPGATCKLYFTPGSTGISKTNFIIAGSNTLPQKASIEIGNEETAQILVSAGSPMALQSSKDTQGSAQSFTIKNISSQTVSNIAPILDTTLSNFVTETTTTCNTNIPSQGTCTVSLAAKQNPNNSSLLDYPITFSNSPSATPPYINCICKHFCDSP